MSESTHQSTALRTGYRALRHLGSVVRDLRELKGLCSGHETQFERIEFGLLCNAVELVELYSGLSSWLERLELLQKAGIQISTEMYEGFAETYADEAE